MTINFFGYRVTVFKVEKLEKQNLSYDKNQAKKDSAEFIASDNFRVLQEKARKAREARESRK